MYPIAFGKRAYKPEPAPRIPNYPKPAQPLPPAKAGEFDCAPHEYAPDPGRSDWCVVSQQVAAADELRNAWLREQLLKGRGDLVPEFPFVGCSPDGGECADGIAWRETSPGSDWAAVAKSFIATWWLFPYVTVLAPY